MLFIEPQNHTPRRIQSGPQCDASGFWIVLICFGACTLGMCWLFKLAWQAWR